MCLIVAYALCRPKDNPHGNPHPDRALIGGILFLLLGHTFVSGRLVFVLFVIHLYDRLHLSDRKLYLIVLNCNNAALIITVPGCARPAGNRETIIL